MTALADIRAGLAANLGAQFPDVSVYPYIKDAPLPPCIEIDLNLDPVDYDEAFDRGTDVWHLIVRAIVGTTTDIGSQMKLDEFVASSGPTSVKAAIEADIKLGGVVQGLHVTNLKAYRPMPLPGSPYEKVLGAEWAVTVWASGA